MRGQGFSHLSDWSRSTQGEPSDCSNTDHTQDIYGIESTPEALKDGEIVLCTVMFQSVVGLGIHILYCSDNYVRGNYTCIVDDIQRETKPKYGPLYEIGRPFFTCTLLTPCNSATSLHDTVQYCDHCNLTHLKIS